jgi:hypothetical protein
MASPQDGPPATCSCGLASPVVAKLASEKPPSLVRSPPSLEPKGNSPYVFQNQKVSPIHESDLVASYGVGSRGPEQGYGVTGIGPASRPGEGVSIATLPFGKAKRWATLPLEELASFSSALPGSMDFKRPCYRLLWPWGRLWLRSSSSHFFIWAS